MLNRSRMVSDEVWNTVRGENVPTLSWTHYLLCSVHVGHLIIAGAVLEGADLDGVIFIPSARPPHKDNDIMFTPDQRYEMLRLAVAGDPHFDVSSIEMNRAGPSYTIDTIREMGDELPADTELFFLVGRDNLTEIDTWKEPGAILDECTVLVADRPGGSHRVMPAHLAGRVREVRTPGIEISSSDIRRRIRDGMSFLHLVPAGVHDHILSRTDHNRS